MSLEKAAAAPVFAARADGNIVCEIKLTWESPKTRAADRIRRLFSIPADALDCDLVFLLLDGSGEVLQTADTQLRRYRHAISYLSDSQSSDDPTGDVVHIDTSQLPSYVKCVKIAAHLYDAAARHQDWRMLHEPRLTVCADSAFSAAQCISLHTEAPHVQGLFIGELVRASGVWVYRSRMIPLDDVSQKQTLVRQLALPHSHGVPQAVAFSAENDACGDSFPPVPFSAKRGA